MPDREAHANEFPGPRQTVHFREDGRCSYCGSLSVADAIKAIETRGTRYSGSDWKYGWPHKFYLDVPCEPFEAQIGSRSYWDEEKGERVEEVFMGTRTCEYRKFYSTHLNNCTDEEFQKFNELSKRFFGITWGFNEEKGLFYLAVPGIQRWGTIE